MDDTVAFFHEYPSQNFQDTDLIVFSLSSERAFWMWGSALHEH